MRRFLTLTTAFAAVAVMSPAFAHVGEDAAEEASA